MKVPYRKRVSEGDFCRPAVCSARKRGRRKCKNLCAETEKYIAGRYNNLLQVIICLVECSLLDLPEKFPVFHNLVQIRNVALRARKINFSM